MLSQHLISNSNNNFIDFNYILNLAKLSKCDYFITRNNKLYCAEEGSSIIHEFDIPFLLPNDIEFEISKDELKAILDKYEYYFIPDAFPYVLLPSIYWDMYIAGDIYSEFVAGADYMLFDKTTKQPLEQVRVRTVMYSYFKNIFNIVFNGFVARQFTLSNPYRFPNMQENEQIRKVLDGKTVDGASLCVFDLADANNSKIAFCLYKGLFSLTKADSLDIEIRFDRFKTKEFMASFIVYRKKNPIKNNKYGARLIETVHVMYVNLV